MSGELELCANVSPTDSPTQAHLGFAHAEGGQEVLGKWKMEETEKGRHVAEKRKGPEWMNKQIIINESMEENKLAHFKILNIIYFIELILIVLILDFLLSDVPVDF